MTLKSLNLQTAFSALSDHHRYSGEELVFDNDWPVVCTEKDSIKISRLENIPHNCWYLRVAAEIDPDGERRLESVLAGHGICR